MFDDPKYRTIVTESTVHSIGRSISVYFGIIIIATQISRMIGSFMPSARFDVAIVLLVFIGLWTLMSLFFHIDLYKARKQDRQQQATNSSNQPLQLTADRRDDPVSIHEPPYTPSFPRFVSGS
jgi:hypothetical protein